MMKEATFKRGGKAVPLDPKTAAAQAAVALAGGPVPMPSWWVGFDPAAVPQYRPPFICLKCGTTFRDEYATQAHKHDTARLPPICDGCGDLGAVGDLDGRVLCLVCQPTGLRLFDGVPT